MTEFKGKNGEGVRPSRVVEGKLETGVGSPAGSKYGGGAGRGGWALRPLLLSASVGKFLMSRALLTKGDFFLVGLEDPRP